MYLIAFGPWLALCRSLQTLGGHVQEWRYITPLVELIIFVYLGQVDQRLRLGVYWVQTFVMRNLCFMYIDGSMVEFITGILKSQVQFPDSSEN
jgi:hypothetical protein